MTMQNTNLTQQNHKKYFKIRIFLLKILPLIFLLAIIFYPLVAHAWWDDLVGKAVTGALEFVTMILNGINSLLGRLLIVLMEFVVMIAGYNKFIDNPYVNEGWKILRDLVNMFFVLGLLFIAFVTVLKIEKYQWNKLLSRLLVMAILVNFSKTICGLIIDFFQVLMLTFVNAFKDITAGNIFNALKVTDWFSLAPEGATGQVDWKKGLLSLTGSMLALLFTITTVVTVLIFCVILCFRMVALWILVVFSPLAFFAWSFEGAAGKVSSFANDWWNQFFNYCVIGPFIAFFLWISLLTMVKINQDQMFSNYPADKRKATNMGGERAGSLENLTGFIIGIVMLVAGLQKSASFGVAGGSMGAKAVNAVKSRASKAASSAAAMPGRAVKGAAKGAYRQVVQPLAKGVSERYQAAGGMRGVGKAITRAPGKIKAAGLGMEATEKKGIMGKAIKGAGRLVSGAGIVAEKGGKAGEWVAGAPGRLAGWGGKMVEKGRKAATGYAGAELGKEGGKTVLPVLAAAAGGILALPEMALKLASKAPKAALGAAVGLADLAPKAKREYAGKRFRARLSTSISGKNKDNREIDKKESERVFNETSKINPKNMKEVGGLINDMVDGKKAYDPKMMEGALRAYAAGGKLTKKKLDKVRQKTGFMQDKDPQEQVLLFEELEELTEKKNGSRPSFSPYKFNPATNEIEDTSGLEAVKQQIILEMAQQLNKTPDQMNEIFNDIDFHDLIKKKDNGTYGINPKSKEYNRLKRGNSDQRNVLTSIEDSSNQYQDWIQKNKIGDDDPLRTKHAFHKFGRATELDYLERKEQTEGVARTNTSQYASVHDNVDSFNVAAKGIELAVAELIGAARNIKNVSSLSDLQVENGNQKAQFLVGNNEERLKLLKDNPERFKQEREQIAKDLGKTDFDQISSKEFGNSKTVQQMDKAASRMSVDDLERTQNYIKATSVRYDTDGRVRKGFDIEEENENLNSVIGKRKKEEGVSSQVNSIVSNVAGEEGTVVNDQGTDALDDAIGPIINQIKNMPMKDAIRLVAERIKQVLQNTGNDTAATDSVANKLAEKFLGIRKEVEKRSKDGSSVRDSAAIDLSSFFSGINSLTAGKDPSKVDMQELAFAINVMLNKMQNEIASSALRPKDFNLTGLETKLNTIKNQIKDMITASNSYEVEIAALEEQISTEPTEQAKRKLRERLKDTQRKQSTRMEGWRNLQSDLLKLIKKG
jgi:hypothetical protein